MEEKVDEKENGDKLETIVAILIALVVVVAAVVAWRASQVDDAAGDADYDGLRSAVNAEETRALNYVNAYEDLGMYVNYWRQNRLSELLGEEVDQSGGENAVLQEQIKEVDELATANEGFFETRFLNRDGTYNVQRQLGEMWADAAKERDLEYTSKFAEADKLRSRTRQFLLVLLVLSVAPVFFSLVESVSGRARQIMIGLGSLFAVAGVVMWIALELTKV